MTSLIRRSLPTALAGALVAGALAVPVIAQESGDDTDTTTESTEDSTDESTEDDANEGRRGSGIRFGFRVGNGLGEDYLTDVAAELGIPVEELQAAVESVSVDRFVERLDERVAAGDLTREQADRLAAAAEDGTLEEVGTQVRLELLEATLDDRVAAGELTQEEADEILAAAEDGDFPRGRGHGRRGQRGASPGVEAEVEDASV